MAESLGKNFSQSLCTILNSAEGPAKVLWSSRDVAVKVPSTGLPSFLLLVFGCAAAGSAAQLSLGCSASHPAELELFSEK